MKSLLTNAFIILSLFLFSQCNNPIKNEDAIVYVEEGTIVNTGKDTTDNLVNEVDPIAEEVDPTLAHLIGYWVGYFKMADHEYAESINLDEGYSWNRENKINISIDKIVGDEVFGHSVVAGNDRPFKGAMVLLENNNGISYIFDVREPGDDKYDGHFTFEISNDKLSGKWKAYKKIDIQNRVYTLEKKPYQYDPNVQLVHVKDYVNWEKFTEDIEVYQVDGETEEWIYRQFSTATELMYEINASTTLLKKADVENLKKGDLTIIRNTIYARHGYSFKNRPLRVFFDAQPWYIPVHTDITTDFTDIEIKNIELLMSFEENAAEYYDSFGRG
ncbi:YARHG domain-containing protein [Crocinitomix catalasitica]|uniref:YARHG domain-containing protein n=1 Tax=Crocinitomix catalasitica TaxID=184607 RepID=UPI00047F49BF|nr:YARHG domain-containing protein [Crocinitomix catalasitica]